MPRISEDRKQLIAELRRQPGFDALRGWVADSRDVYFKNLATALYQGTEVNETDLAYRRGFFRGMNRVLNEVDFSVKAIERELAKDVREVD